MIAAGQDFTPEKVQECMCVYSNAKNGVYATVLAFSHIVIKFNFSTYTLFLLFTLVYTVHSISWLKTLVLYPVMRYHASQLQLGLRKCFGSTTPPATLSLNTLQDCWPRFSTLRCLRFTQNIYIFIRVH